MANIVQPLVGSILASLSVLLTIWYGMLAAQVKLLDSVSARHISRLCVKLLLPALLVVNLGSELHQDTVMRYIPILVWAIVYNAVSLGCGVILTRLLKLPNWVTPAVMINNTTSLPLLLVQSLGSTGTLSVLFASDHDSVDQVVYRARSYFLVSAVVSNTFTFGFGRELLGGFDEDPAEEMEAELYKGAERRPFRNEDQANGQNGSSEQEEDPEQQTQEDDDEQPDERTSLLPSSVRHYGHRAVRRGFRMTAFIWDRMPPLLQRTFAEAVKLINPPAVGAVIGVIIGLVPSLHRVFFNDTYEGGYFNAWLTTSLKNVGELFITLQVIIVGVKLSSSLRKMKRGESSGNVPWKGAIIVLIVRFVVWPVVSIALVWVLVSKSSILGDDPVLWFAMMLMPTGPSAMKLLALAEVDDADEGTIMSIAKFLTLSYTISPLIAPTVTVGIKVCESLR